MKAKQPSPLSIFIAIVIVAVIFVWSTIQQKKSAKMAEDALHGRKGEEVLAMIDTKQNPPDPKDVERYAELLDQIQKRCLETRSEITLMAFSLTKSSIAAGYEDPKNFEANLESLKTILSIGESITNKQGRPSSGLCIPKIQAMITENKQAAAENEQEKLEQQKEDEARQRQAEREKNQQQ